MNNIVSNNVDNILNESEENINLGINGTVNSQKDALKEKSEIILEESFPISGSPYYGFDPNGQTLFIRNVPKNCSKKE